MAPGQKEECVWKVPRRRQMLHKSPNDRCRPPSRWWVLSVSHWFTECIVHGAKGRTKQQKTIRSSKHSNDWCHIMLNPLHEHLSQHADKSLWAPCLPQSSKENGSIRANQTAIWAKCTWWEAKHFNIPAFNITKWPDSWGEVFATGSAGRKSPRENKIYRAQPPKPWAPHNEKLSGHKFPQSCLLETKDFRETSRTRLRRQDWQTNLRSHYKRVYIAIYSQVCWRRRSPRVHGSYHGGNMFPAMVNILYPANLHPCQMDP